MLAQRGAGTTSPNPMVGALVIEDGEVVGRGYHKEAGGPHAEVFALRDAAGRTQGSTLIVTLEPCSHYGRTPPCTEAIIAAGIARVVIGVRDPNPKISGRGVNILREHGVEVIEGGRMCRVDPPLQDVDHRTTPVYDPQAGLLHRRKGRDKDGREPVDHRRGGSPDGPPTAL